MNNFWKGLQFFAAALVFVLAAVYLSSLIGGDKDKPLPPPPPPVAIWPAVSCPADFLSYQTLVGSSDRIIKLIDSRKSSYAENGQFKKREVVVVKAETDESKVACGYLFVKAGTGTNGSLQSWENLYINPKQFGGHINPAEHFGLGDSKDHSEYLYSLNKIKYWANLGERSRGKISTADWAALLNVSAEVDFIIALNTNDTSGFIDEVSIAYKCWNPNTGQENKDCAIEIKSNEDTTGTLP